MPRFVIPNRDDDLRLVNNDFYYVSELVDVVNDADEVKQQIRECKRKSDEGEWEWITENFDTFFAIARANNQVPWEFRRRLFMTLFEGFKNLGEPLKELVNEVFGAEAITDEIRDQTLRYSNCLLMYVYLLCRLGYHIENEVCKRVKLANTGQKGRQKTSIPKDDLSEMWFEYRVEILGAFCKIAYIKARDQRGKKEKGGIKFLWQPAIINEGFVKCILTMVLKFLENPEVSKANSKDFLQTIFMAIRAIAVFWDQYAFVAEQLMEKVPQLEYFQANSTIQHFPFIDAIMAVSKENDMDPLIAAMISLVGRVDVGKLGARGEASSRPYTLFITTLAEKYPELLVKHISYLIPFLGVDPPSLRNALLTSFVEIIKRVFQDDLDKKAEELRDSMLLRLQDHLIDSSAIVRARVLNLWKELAERKMIPNRCIRSLLVSEVGNRLYDKGVTVRKNAAYLLAEILKNNAFDSNLNFERMHKIWEEKKKELRLLRQENPEFDTVGKAMKMYEPMEAEIRKFFKIGVENFIEKLTNDAAEELMSIDEQLKNGNIKEELIEDCVIEIEPLEESIKIDEDPRLLKERQIQTIAHMIIKQETRLEGCATFLQFAVKEKMLEEDVRKTDVDIEKVVDQLAIIAKEYCLQAIVVSEMNDDEQMLIEEDRARDFKRKVKKLDKEISFYLDALFFIFEMEKCLPMALRGISHSQPSEMQPAIIFVAECRKFELRGSEEAIKNICTLIWRKDAQVQGLVKSTGKDVFVSKNPDSKIGYQRTAKNLMDVMMGASTLERASLEQALSLVLADEKVEDAKFRGNSVLDYLFEYAITGSHEHRLAAIRLIGVVANAQKELVQKRIEELFEVYRNKSEEIRIEVLKVVAALSSDMTSIDPEKLDEIKPPFRIPRSHRLVKLIIALITKGFNRSTMQLWIPHCREGISVIFGISENTNEACSQILSLCVKETKDALAKFLSLNNKLRRLQNNQLNRTQSTDNNLRIEVATTSTSSMVDENMSQYEGSNPPGSVRSINQERPLNWTILPQVETLLAEETVFPDQENVADATFVEPEILVHRLQEAKSEWQLCTIRLLYLIGEIALRLLVYTEMSVPKEMRKFMPQMKEMGMMKPENQKRLSMNTTMAVNKLSNSNSVDQISTQVENWNWDDENSRERTPLLVNAMDEEDSEPKESKEDTVQYRAQFILDKNLFSQDTMMGRVIPFVLTVLKEIDSDLDVDPELFEAAVMCLTKLMLINKRLCKLMLPCFFSFFKKATIRARNNMVIALADLSFRFPNFFDNFNDRFLARIRDSHSGVRYTCLLVLSHMILNDMIKVRGTVAELAPCIIDNDHHISQLSRFFFSELSKKHNVLYNMMPDIISRLSLLKKLSQEQYEEIMKFLLKFIKKDTQIVALVDKLCQRFQYLKDQRAAMEANPRMPEYLAYCIAQFQFSVNSFDKAFRRIVDTLPSYKSFLNLPGVYQHFHAVIVQMKKIVGKSAEKADLKEEMDEFEIKLRNLHEIGVEDDEAEERAQAHRANKRKSPRKDQNKPPQSRPKPPPSVPKRARISREGLYTLEVIEEGAMEMDETQEPTTSTRRIRIESSSDSDSSFISDTE